MNRTVRDGLFTVNSLPTSPEHAPAVEQTRWFMEEVQPHEPKIRAWLHARFPSIGDVDDLIQETYLRVLRARSAGKLDHPKAYLFATARNAALDRFRRNQVISFECLADVTDSSVLVDGQRAIDATQREQELDILAAAIRGLPGRCREILVLRKYHGLSHREIADRLGISPHTVNAQITVAMIKCREYFQARGLLQPSHHVTPTSHR
jgi:RNA polymerase sigma factor (sigma-70 family)